MKKKKMIIISFLLVGGLSFAALAGMIQLFHTNEGAQTLVDGKEEFKKLYQYFTSSETKYEITGTISLFDKETSGALTEKMSFANYKNGDESYLQVGSLQTFVHGGITVQVDTIQQYIHVQEMTRSITGGLFEDFEFNRVFADTNGLHIRVTYFDRSADERVLYIENDFTPQIKKMAISYNPVTFQINSTEVTWWKDNVSLEGQDTNECWLMHTDMKYSSPGEHNIQKQIEKFIVRKDGGYSSSPAYSDYTFNYLPSNDGQTN